MTKLPIDGDTIAAIATPIGEGALAVIRVSGPSAISAVDRIFEGSANLAQLSGYMARFGRIVVNGNHIDDVVVTVFRSPHSFTGEDSVEVSCHGGMYNTQRVLLAILEEGVRQATPGEFSKRAFLNGKMDLSQAEAVADLIAARSEASHRASMNQLEGRFSERITQLRKELIDLSSLVELELDFSEEGIDLIAQGDIILRIEKTKARLQEMADTYRVGKLYREGVEVAIVGRPNAGKSSLFNALLKESRAIVTEIAGTTRDTLEEHIVVNGVLFRLSDTAGLRETNDPIESQGVDRSRKAVERADVLLMVDDITLGQPRDSSLAFLAGMTLPKSGIFARNKVDLYEVNGFEPTRFDFMSSRFVEVHVSAKTGVGLDKLRDELFRIVVGESAKTSGIQVTNSRHHQAIEKAIQSLKAAADSADAAYSGEFISADIRLAADSLSEITGEITSEEVLNNIFGQFCIGK